MKFGKQLVRTLYKKWGNAYLNYKALKGAIKKLLADREGDQELSPHSSSIKEEEHVVSLIDIEATKVNAHYLKILTACQGEFSQLEKLLAEKKLPEQQLCIKYDQLCQRLDKLRGFVFLNHLGFQKILKKIDKKLSLSLKVKLMTQVEEKDFYKSRNLSNLIIRAGCKSSDLHGEPRRKDHLCAICLDLPTKPVVLSCAHPFCSHCLANAFQLRHSQCPVCRKEQTLDPRKYEVNKVLEDFIRRHFPTFKEMSPKRNDLMKQTTSPLSSGLSFGCGSSGIPSLDLGDELSDLDKSLCWNVLGFEDVDKISSLGSDPAASETEGTKKSPTLDLLFGDDSLSDPFELPGLPDIPMKMDLSGPSASGPLDLPPDKADSTEKESKKCQSLPELLSQSSHRSGLQNSLCEQSPSSPQAAVRNEQVLSPSTHSTAIPAPPPLTMSDHLCSGSTSSLAAASSVLSSQISPNVVIAEPQNSISQQHFHVQVPVGVMPKKFRVACVHCYKSKTSCDGYRPCTRCIRLHKGDSCVDRQQKKRGRPRKPGVAPRKQMRTRLQAAVTPPSHHTSLRTKPEPQLSGNLQPFTPPPTCPIPPPLPPHAFNDQNMKVLVEKRNNLLVMHDMYMAQLREFEKEIQLHASVVNQNYTQTPTVLSL